MVSRDRGRNGFFYTEDQRVDSSPLIQLLAYLIFAMIDNDTKIISVFSAIGAQIKEFECESMQC